MATNTPVRKDYIPFRWPAIPWGRYGRWSLIFFGAVFLMWLGDRFGDDPRRAVQATISGLLVGGIYSLIAVGIVMINKATGIFNFAHGAMMLITALIFWSFFTTSAESLSMVAVIALAAATVVSFIAMNSWRDLLNPVRLGIGAVVVILLTLGMSFGGSNEALIRALIAGLTSAVLLGLLIEHFAIRPLVGQPIFTMVLMTLALDSLFRGIAVLLWGSSDKALGIFAGLFDKSGVDNPVWKFPATTRMDVASLLDESARITTINMDTRLIIAFIISLSIFVVFVLFFQYTNVGLGMRATSENQVLAQSVGMRVRVILATAWAIAALLALAAGVLYGGSTNVGLSMPQIVFLAFPAVLLGGLESIGGALLGGLIIGLAQTWGDYLFANEAGTRLVPYVILMVVLVIRPDGLFGLRRIERI